MAVRWRADRRKWLATVDLPDGSRKSRSFLEQQEAVDWEVVLLEDAAREKRAASLDMEAIRGRSLGHLVYICGQLDWAGKDQTKYKNARRLVEFLGAEAHPASITMASLEISLSDIPSEGLRFSSVVTRMDLDLRVGDPEFHGDLDFSGRVCADAKEAWVNGLLQGGVHQECVRCLGRFEKILSIPISAYYRSEDVGSIKEKSKGRNKDEVNSSEEDDDSYPILNCRFNLGEMLREQLLLSIPIQALCQQQCQGLCQVCGQNLNQFQCGCKVLDTELPFAILRRKVSFGKNL